MTNMGLLLAPGAGADRDHSALVAVEEAVSPIPVARMDFPYRKAGRKAPDRAPVLVQAVRDEAAAFCAATGLASDQLVLGGRSLGGRICSMAVAELDDPLPAAALVLISYPLHPPGKPEKLRVEHFGRLSLPCLFLSGTRDAFATTAELESATALIPGPVTHLWIDGGDHGLRRRDPEVAENVAGWVRRLA